MDAVEFDSSDPVASFAAVWRKIVTEPRVFFEALPPAGRLEPALVFALVCLVIGGFEVLLFGGGLRGMLLLVLLGAMRLAVGSAIVVLVARNLYDGQGGYEATLRVIGYSSAPAVAIGIPVVGHFAALYGAYLTILGVARAQGFDTVRSTLTILATIVTGFMIAHAIGVAPLFDRFNPLLR
jgi:hypothetical protein